MADSHVVSVQALLEAGAHFGHITRRWNPKMAKFIYGVKNGIHQIDVRKTQLLVDYARDIVFDIASKGHSVLFVGTKANAKKVIEEQAKRAEINYVSERWLGGMLTNFPTIRRSINRLSNIDRMESDGTFENITKKERLLLMRERERLRKVFGGIETMKNIPGVIFVVDARKEHLAVKEARVLGIPVIGIIDTNTDPDSVDYPIPANDDSRETAQIITSILADAVIEGMANIKIRIKELGYNPYQKEQNIETERTDRRNDRGGDRRGSDRRSGGDRRSNDARRGSSDRRNSEERSGGDRRSGGYRRGNDENERGADDRRSSDVKSDGENKRSFRSRSTENKPADSNPTSENAN